MLPTFSFPSSSATSDFASPVRMKLLLLEPRPEPLLIGLCTGATSLPLIQEAHHRVVSEAPLHRSLSLVVLL